MVGRWADASFFLVFNLVGYGWEPKYPASICGMYQRFLEIKEKITCQIGLEFQVSTAWAKVSRKMICFEILTILFRTLPSFGKAADDLTISLQLLVRRWNTVDGSILAITHLGCKRCFVNNIRVFIPGGATPYFRRQEYGRLPWPIPFLKSCCIRNRTLTLRLAGGRLSFVKETKDPMDGPETFQKQSFNKALYRENRCENSWKTILVCTRTWIDKNYESNQTVDFKSKRCCLDLHVPGEAFLVFWLVPPQPCMNLPDQPTCAFFWWCRK